MSAESGISTFRDANGLWENHDVMDVATPEGWRKNPELVLDFYNQRRRQLKTVEPNAAHFYLKQLEDKYDVSIITQNVDNLHERVGSSDIIHLHGELNKVRSEKNEQLIYDWSEDLVLGDVGADGAQLRPYIVWFGEMVPMMEKAVAKTLTADIMLVIGTSLQVYPAASLIDYVTAKTPIYVIDPHEVAISRNPYIHVIPKRATEGVIELDRYLNDRA